MGINNREDNTRNKIKTTLRYKTINNPGEAIMIIVFRGSNDSLMEGKAGRKEIELNVQGFNVWETKKDE